MKEPEDDTDIALKNVVDAVLEQINKKPDVNQDPFDIYIEYVQSGFFANEEICRSRFIQGYHALTDQLALMISKEKQKEAEEDTRDT